MKREFFAAMFVLTAIGVSLPGCGGGEAENDGKPAGGGGGGEAQPFVLAWSEYPSWSIFGVADELGLINGKEGERGEIEEKHGIDIVLKEAGYDSCLNMFSSKNCDAVCMTNMDALIVSPSRDCVAVLPTSTSKGADACIVVGIPDLDALKEHKVYGLKGTVSEYCFARCLEKAGKDEADYQFTNQDPAAAAVAMKNKAADHQAIMVWNPFVLQTLNDRPDAKVLFDSSQIPGEIVDMVVIGKDSLAKPGADKFVQAVIETFYRMNAALADPQSGDETLVAVGKKFSQLGLDDMKKVVQQTVFYKSPAEAEALLTGDEFKNNMKTVQEFCVNHGLVKDASYDFGDADQAGGVKLRFDPTFVKKAKEAKP